MSGMMRNRFPLEHRRPGQVLEHTIDSQTTISVIIMRNDVEPGRDILKQLAESGSVACGVEIPPRSVWEMSSNCRFLVEIQFTDG